MKSKIWVFALGITFLFSLGACKSKESAYKAAYEKAKEKEMQEQSSVEEVTPVSKPRTGNTNSNATVQKEKITTVDGSGLRQYSIVISSFKNKTNATSLKERMRADGYNAIIAQNESQMYRVIIATFDYKADAAAERDAFKAKYYNNPDFQGAWILEQQY